MPGDTSKGTMMEGKFMANRREILQGSAAAFAAAPILSSAAAGAGEPANPAPVSLHKVIYDQRFADSAAFGAAAEARGLPVAAIAGDVTPLWFNDLDPLWRREPAAVAGLTAHGPLFCLERLAWEKGMRVVFRADHGAAADGRLVHSVHAPEPLLKHAASLAADGDKWPARMAELLAACPAAGHTLKTVQCETGMAADPAAEPLISWVIAPVGRAALT